SGCSPNRRRSAPPPPTKPPCCPPARTDRERLHRLFPPGSLPSIRYPPDRRDLGIDAPAHRRPSRRGDRVRRRKPAWLRNGAAVAGALAAALLAACTLASSAASVQDYPSRPITLVVPFPPGG